MPYICTPLTGKTELDILKQLEVVVSEKPDLIEWRADFFMELANLKLVLNIVQKIKAYTTIPLLFTIRSIHEGGEAISLSEQEKVDVLREVCLKTEVDIVDYEVSNAEGYVNDLRMISKESNKRLILSYHNFTRTPENDELLTYAKRAETYGADIAKIAVMPKTRADVFRLLEITSTMDRELNIPVVTMSMGTLGGLSRVIGWAYGSIITFGVGADVSAPGQMPVHKLRQAIEATQELTGTWEE